MIKALNTATQGILQSERRATDIAKDILASTSESASFSSFEAQASKTLPSDTAPATSGPSTTAFTGPGFGSLIQQLADLRAEETTFKANVAAFKKIDETLGSLLDDES